jgi:hypothetical protein
MAHSFVPGGSLGTMIDHLTGKMYSYPTPLRLRVGEHLRFEHSDAATATLVAPVGTQLAAAHTAPAAQATAAAAPAVTAATAVRASAVRVTQIAPARPRTTAAAPSPPPSAVSDSLDARDLRMRGATEKK